MARCIQILGRGLTSPRVNETRCCRGGLRGRKGSAMFRNLPLAEIKHARLVPALVVSLFLTATASAEPTQIQRGEYLARAGDCVSCHTAKQGEPFSGGDRLNTPFGYMLAPNITSDPDTGIGRWSADDFYRSLHDGVNRRGQDMYPTMPYDFYTNVTRGDLRISQNAQAREERNRR